MSQSIKKTVQKAMLLPRKTKYERERLRLLKEYEEECRRRDEYVSDEKIKAETSGKVERLDIETFISNKENGIVYDDQRYYLIYDPKLGILRKESERLVYEYLEDNPCAVFIYGDEDYFAVSKDSGSADKGFQTRAFRYFKPEFSPKTLGSFDYINAFAIKGDLLKSVSAEVKEYPDPSAVMYELTFEACIKLKNEGREKEIQRIPAVLVSKETEIPKKDYESLVKTYDLSKYMYPYVLKKELSLSSKEYEGLRREKSAKMGILPEKEDPSVSMIIPSKDNPNMLITCIESLHLNEVSNVELIVIDNGSSDENRRKIEDYLKNSGTENRYIYEPGEFNYSLMNNTAAKEAKGEVLLLLNDDIEAEDGGFIKKMASEATAKGVGCVGCGLLYPNGLIQHVGIAGGVDGPAHKHMGESDDVRRGHGDNTVNKNVLAVTGACLAIRKDLFEEQGGLCEELKVGYNDVDLCMTLYEKGYKNVLLNEVKLTHHESVSRGKDAKNQAKSERLKAEKDILSKRHPELMRSDPYEGGCEDFKFSFERQNTDNTVNAKGSFGKRTSNDDEGWIYSSFEKFETLVNEKNEKILSAKGFALVPGIDNMRFDFEMLLEKDDTQFIIPIERRLRTDLLGRFNGSQNTELCGMDFVLGLEGIPSGEYKVRMYAKDHGNVRELITDTGLSVQV